jgi:sensor histidine kinase YesM
MARRKLFATFRSRLIVTALVFLLMVTFLLTVLLSIHYVNTLQTHNEETTLSAFSVAAKQMESLLKDAYMAGVMVRQNVQVMDYLKGIPATEVEKIEAQRDMLSVIGSTMARYENINAILFYRKDGSLSGASSTWSFFYNEPDSRQELAQLFVPRDGWRIDWVGAYWHSFFTEHDIIQPKDSGQIMICGIQPFVYSYSARSTYQDTIYMLVSVKESALRQCYQHLDVTDGSVLLLNRDGLQISGADISLTGQKAFFMDSIDPDSSYGSMNIKYGTEYQLIYYRIPSTGWLLTRYIPMNVYMNDVTNLYTSFIGIALVLIAASCVLYATWANRFTKPFREIVSTLKTVSEKNQLGHMMIHSDIKEFDLISTQFNLMSNSITQLHRRDMETQRAMMMMEIRHLQAQINPHFIYNSIASIRWQATFLGADKVSDMLVELAETLKPIFSEWSILWTLEEEMAYINHYMKLMQLRYGATFSVHMDIPQDLMRMNIPRFVLQPLLENCCEHGTGDSGGIEVYLSVRREGQDAILRVRDNGQGIPQERLAAIKHTLFSNEPASQQGGRPIGIALRNVHRRIQLFYGEEYGLSIHSDPGEGTSVDVRIKVEADMLPTGQKSGPAA